MGGWMDESKPTSDHLITNTDKNGWEVLAVGPNDRDLMNRLRNAGTDHRKFMRMIAVYVDLTGPLYWWTVHSYLKSVLSIWISEVVGIRESSTSVRVLKKE